MEIRQTEGKTGFYTEVLFRQYGVRFIAIGNGVDSADASTGEFAPFLNIMNEWYLRDCSRKQLAAHQARARAGKPTTACPPYGYIKDPADKHHWLIDEEAAAVIKRAYQLCVNGHGPFQIAAILRDDKIECPSVYLAKKGARYVEEQSRSLPPLRLERIDGKASAVLSGVYRPHSGLPDAYGVLQGQASDGSAPGEMAHH